MKLPPFSILEVNITLESLMDNKTRKISGLITTNKHVELGPLEVADPGILNRGARSWRGIIFFRSAD